MDGRVGRGAAHELRLLFEGVTGIGVAARSGYGELIAWTVGELLEAFYRGGGKVRRSGERPGDWELIRRACRWISGGHTNILKRLLIHAGGFNLGLVMRHLIDTLEFTLRQSYEKLDKAINSETQRRTAWQTLLDRLGTACFAVMLWALVQYLLASLL